MDGFVDYGKRSVQLPPGCKDLIDLLRPGVSGFLSAIPPNLPDGLRHGGMVKGELSELAKYVARVFDSRALACSLWVRPPGDQLTFEVQRFDAGEVTASVIVEMGTKREKAVRDFIAARGFQAPDDSIPKQFSPNLPVELICHLSPLPSEVSILSNLGAELFRRVCGLSDQSELCYTHCETMK
jgi:hypothetical protein